MTLVWNPRSRRVWISIFDLASDEQQAVPVPHDRALDASNHAYAYLAG